MKKLFLFLLFSISFNFLNAQDVIYTITGKINNQTTSIDSILVENMSNNTSMLFKDLPDLPDYNINLTQKAFWGATGIKTFGKNKNFVMAGNYPGLLRLAYDANPSSPVSLTVYNMQGQKVYSLNNQILSKGNVLNIHIGRSGFYLIKVDSELGVQTFKATGSSRQKNSSITATISGHPVSVFHFKSAETVSDNDFSFTVGDSIRFSAFKQGYYAYPVVLKVSSSGSANFAFNNGVTTGTFTDPRDGQTYKTVKIGNQVWMAENLKYLPSVSPSSGGSNTDPYYYVYGYQGNSVSEAKATANFNTYGVLYNWPAAMKACPSGWHLPSDEEWKTLEMTLGMSQSEADKAGWRGTGEGKQMKSTNGWDDNGNGTNSSGFTALPGGYRYYNGNCTNLGGYGYWWSVTEYNDDYSWSRNLGCNSGRVYRYSFNKGDGFSVRCVRD